MDNYPKIIPVTSSYLQHCSWPSAELTFWHFCLSCLLCVPSYCNNLNIRGIKFSGFNENDILAHSNFGIHEIPWFMIVKKI